MAVSRSERVQLRVVLALVAVYSLGWGIAHSGKGDPSSGFAMICFTIALSGLTVSAKP